MQGLQEAEIGVIGWGGGGVFLDPKRVGGGGGVGV